MEVLFLTLLLSLILAAVFIILFYRDRNRNRFASPESDALIPFEEEKSRPAKPKSPPQNPPGPTPPAH
ncbi:hypothetical protein [Ruficoccus sp. ZRK36]|uniref:hypothetical protein n=1 Tax=Ruficoccus sp. ZRK36 TaxID=2866311 RepID=UPI001C73A573|nr:hypothetical protein [Ruficoccus sp. ZRK36]QYY35997.1 hypothetical protein K0V07_00650 [Ruficoccus sp. ZRK36]